MNVVRWVSMFLLVTMCLPVSAAIGQTNDGASKDAPNLLTRIFKDIETKALRPYFEARIEIEIGVALGAGTRCSDKTKDWLAANHNQDHSSEILAWMKGELQDKGRQPSLVAVDYTQACSPSDDSTSLTVSVYARRPADWVGMEQERGKLLSMPKISLESVDKSEEPIIFRERLGGSPELRNNQVNITLLTFDKTKAVSSASRVFEWNGSRWIGK